MKKKPTKDAKGIIKKMPHLIQTFVPATAMKNIQEQQPFQCSPNKLEDNKPFTPLATPFEIPSEWSSKTEEEFNAELVNDIPYEDPSHDQLESNLPLSFISTGKNNFKWLRPNDFIINNNIDKEIKRLYPKKNIVTTREDIKQFYTKTKEKESQQNDEEGLEEGDNNVDDYIRQDSEAIKKTIYKDFYKFLEEPNDIKVIRTIEREENDEEFNKRREEEERKKAEELKIKKTQTKRIDIKTKTSTLIVKPPEELNERLKKYDIDPSNIDVRNLVSAMANSYSEINRNNLIKNDSFISWISSIYQFILDLEINDCVDNKSIFTNIYPQKGGVPIYNPNGHYVIKLYFMGKARRIDIDDRMPCSKDGEYIFPKCEFLTELWPGLFTKALMKLNIYKIKHPSYARQEEIVDTSYIYSLTGYHADIVQSNEDDNTLKNLLQNCLNDDMFLNKKKYFLCLHLQKDESIGKYNKIDYDKEIENYTISNDYHESRKDMISDQSIPIVGFKRVQPHKTRSSMFYKRLSSIANPITRKGTMDDLSTIVKQRTMRKEKTVMHSKFTILDNKLKVLSNYAYSLNDFFSNNSFNMNRLKPLDFSDLKRCLKDSTVVFKQLTASEKKEYIKQRKELKKAQNDIKLKRILELTNEGRTFLIVKIKNQSIGQYKLNSILSYSEEEINMAKKCLINDWKYPPPDFFNNYFKQCETILSTTSRGEGQNEGNEESPRKKPGSLDWTRAAYIQLIGNDLSQYQAENIKDPILRQSGGNWMDLFDFKSLFNTFIILNNPSSLFTGGNVSVDNNWHYYGTDIYEPLDDYFVFKLSAKDIAVSSLNYSAFIIFQPNNDNTLACQDKIYSYIICEVIDQDKQPVITSIKLNKFYSTYVIEDLSGEKDYYLLIKGGIYQFGFYFHVFAEAHSIESMSYLNYYKNENEYTYAEFKVEHPIIERDTFYLISRILIETNKGDNPDILLSTQGDESMKQNADAGNIKLMFNLKYPIKYLKTFFHIYIVNSADKNDKGKEIFFNEMIELKEGKYFAVIAINKSMYSLKEGAVDICMAYDNKAYRIEQIENIDYYQLSDSCLFNRHSIVFREIIYSSDNVHTSLFITAKLKTIEEGKEQASIESARDNKGEGIEQNLRLHMHLYQLTDGDEGQEIDVKFSHGLKGNLLAKWESFNDIIVPHLTFEGVVLPQEDKKKTKPIPNAIEQPQPHPVNHPYLLVCYADIDKKNDKKQKKNILNEIRQKFIWSIRVFPSDSLCFIKDCTKSDHEKELKDQWEIAEPGRSSRATISRRRFRVDKQIEAGNKQLTEEDMKLVTMPRERKLLINEDPNTNATNAFRNSPKKMNRKETKKGLNAMTSSNSTNPIIAPIKLQLNPNKKLPIEKEHCSSYIKTYLKYSYNKRTLQINTIMDQYQKTINSFNVVKDKTRLITEHNEDFNQIIKTEMNQTYAKSESCEMMTSFYKTGSSFRSKNRCEIPELMKHRNTLKQDFQANITSTKSVQDILSNYITYNYDINYMISVYKETEPILKKDNEHIIKLFALICTKKEDQIKNDLKKYTAKDKNTIIKVLEDINFNQWKIKEEIIAKLKDLIK